MKKILMLLIGLLCIFQLSACQLFETTKQNTENYGTTEEIITTTITAPDVADVTITEGSYEEKADDVIIQLADGITIINNNGYVSSDGQVVTITSAGTYVFSGTLSDGQVIINATNNDEVKLVLNGVDITSKTSAPICSLLADKTIITVAEDSINKLTDANTYTNSSLDGVNACLYSKNDLDIKGKGTLVVIGNYNNGIGTKDDLEIKNATIIVSAINNGLKGNDSVEIKSGDITVMSCSDGIKTDNEEDEDKGVISILDGTVKIISTNDGIEATQNVLILGGKISIKTGNGSSSNISNSSDSKKGIKCAKAITISGGTVEIDSQDDSIHSNDSITISDGAIQLSSGDDGIHADTTINITGGKIDVLKSYEGIESMTITISDGSIHVVSSDDGINAAGGDGSTAQTPSRPGGWNVTSSGNGKLIINGGYIYVNSSGDGLDANGSITMTGGTVIVMGPSSGDNGALDYDQTFQISGGILIACGSSQMAQNVSSSSTQVGILVNFTQTIKAGTLISLLDSNSNEIITFSAIKNIQSITISTPEIIKGSSYSIYTGGSTTGTYNEGIYDKGYTEGTLYRTFTASSYATSVGTNNGRF